MSLKILGGQLSGLSLSVPKGDQTRPTSVMLRRKLFDAHQNLDSVYFYDLCAGTGAMGLEACSRGASEVTFIECHAKTLTTLKQNIKLTQERSKSNQLMTKLTLIKNNFQSYALQFKKEYLDFDEEKKQNTILFLDPPYEKTEIYEFFLKSILQEDWFKGTSWIEVDKQKGLAPSWWGEQGVNAKKVYKHGDSAILIVR